MKYIKGGDLYTHFRNNNKFNEAQVKFYIATLAMALGYLHEKKIIYRDLKTKNILMDEEGYVYLADFGMAKFTNQNTNSICGTPSMMAPEILAQK